MAASQITVRYDGPVLAGHRMDVADLAPALLGISELCKLANRRFNRDRADVSVLIGADQEQKCFQFSLEIFQTIWQQAQSLLAHEEIKTAKEILEWIGLIGGPAIGLFKLLKWIGNRPIAGTKFEVRDGKDVVVINVEGENNDVVVYRQTYELLNDSAAISNAKKVVAPVTKDGYEILEFENQNSVTERVTKEEAISIVQRDSVFIPDVEAEEPQSITAWIQVYAPVYDSDANQWQFRYGERHERMDISETDIAEKAIERGGALIDDTYKVTLEIQQTKTATGQFRVKYKIKNVLEFHPAKMKNQTDWVGGDK